MRFNVIMSAFDRQNVGTTGGTSFGRVARERTSETAASCERKTGLPHEDGVRATLSQEPPAPGPENLTSVIKKLPN